jgi:hypothetical protein
MDIPVTNLSVTEIVNDRSQAVWRDVDRRQRNGQPEAPPARASWIQVEHAVDGVDLRHMGVAGYHDVDAALDRIDLQSLQVVQEVDRPSRKADEFGVGVGDGLVAVSTFPRIAVTGAMRRSASMISGRPTSTLSRGMGCPTPAAE